MGKGAKTKGYIKNLSTGTLKKFLYNPNGFGTDRDVTFMEVSSPGSSYPHFQYANGGAKSVSLELFLHDPKSSVVKSYVTFLEGLLPKESSTSKFQKPPQVLFAFGSFVEKCIVTSVGIDYEDFDSSLNPTQATAKLKLVVIK